MKNEMYEKLLSAIKSYISPDDEFVSTLANAAALLKEYTGFFWVGFYLVKDESTLYLGPFQGPAACTYIKYGKGVCGSAWKEKKTLVVPDVELFPGHIACSSLSKSEIVVPLIDELGNVLGVLDIDSRKLSDFDSEDQKYLERVAKWICKTAK